MFSELIKRLESGDGADRELDILVWGVLHGYRPALARHGQSIVGRRDSHADETLAHLHDGQWLPYALEIGRYTASRNACAALQEEVLPGWSCELLFVPATAHVPAIGKATLSDGSSNQITAGGYGTSVCRAHLITILRAREAQD